jgi:hypothetical protein
MYNIEYKSTEDILIMKESIEKYILQNDFENAFLLFLLQISRLNSIDRDTFIIHFKNYFRKQLQLKNT